MKLFQIITFVLLIYSNSLYANKQNKINIDSILDNEDTYSLNIEEDYYQNNFYQNININYTNKNNIDYNLILSNTSIVNNILQGYSMFNIDKSFVKENYSLIIGSQNGFNFLDDKILYYYNYDYIDNELRSKYIVLHSGIYYGNKLLLGKEEINYFIGFEIIYKHISFEVEYIAGNNNISSVTYYLLYKFKKTFQTYIGISNPIPRDNYDSTISIGFNLSNNNL
jgi:hypothetical protein